MGRLLRLIFYGFLFDFPFLSVSFCFFPFPAEAVRAKPSAAPAQVRALFSRIQDIFARERRGDLAPDEIEALDVKARKLLDQTVALGEPAVTPLFAIARGGKSFKSRLWALSAMGLIGGPRAFQDLRSVMDDSGSPDLLRAQAAFLIGAFKGEVSEKSAALCGELRNERLPKPIFVECLRQASALGCAKTEALARIAHAFGSKPRKKDARLVSYALKALAASPAPEALPVLLDLAAYYRREAPARLEALEGIWALRKDLPSLKDSARTILAKLLLESSRRPKAALLILELLDPIKDKSLIPLLGRYKRHPNPAVAALAGREWAELKDRAGKK